MFSVSSTSKSRGRLSRCMAAESTSMCSMLTSGYSRLITYSLTSRHRREVSSTLDLSIETTLLAAAHGEAARDARDALDFRHRVGAQVAGAHGIALLFAEVDAAGELAHEDEIHAVEYFRLEHRGVAQRRMQLHGTQIGVHAELAAQAQQALLGTHRRQTAPISGRRWRPTTRHRPRGMRRALPAAADRRSGRWRCRRTDALRSVNSWPKRLRDLLQYAYAFGDDFGADAVARDDGNLCFHWSAFIGASVRTPRSRRSATAGSRVRRRH